jgi:carbonic anhydrase
MDRSFKDGNRNFQKVYFKTHEQELMDLVENGQSPKALFIGCSDSRVIPDLFLDTKPGDLFVVRNVGNFVPPYNSNDVSQGTASAIDYAVSVLNVSEVIVCGHTYCGACATLHTPEKAEGLHHLSRWLKIGEKARNQAVSTGLEGEPLLRATEMFSIISQIENLLSYPEVKKRVEEEKLFIHGWYYHIESGKIDYFDPDESEFKPLIDE